MTDAPLVTIDEAKAHLKIDADDDVADADLQLKLDTATELVVEYCDVQDPVWDDTTVPARVKSAILLVVADLYKNRGDDAAPACPISQSVEDLLYRWHTPVLA